MEKRNKIIYWAATAWLSLGMLSTGIVQLLRLEEEAQNFSSLGYPSYLMPLLGICKILGVAVILIPKFTLLKEWAYAGFFFCMAGALASHIITGHTAGQWFPPLLLLALTMVSWHFRPAARRIQTTKTT